jgi:hypothetical protein
MAHPLVATMRGGGLEGCGPSQPLPAIIEHRFHGADGADALQLQGIGQQWPSGRRNDDRWRTGGLRSLTAVAGHKLNTGFTAPTERVITTRLNRLRSF